MDPSSHAHYAVKAEKQSLTFGNIDSGPPKKKAHSDIHYATTAWAEHERLAISLAS
jgi:hypothetical protein